MDPKSLYEKKAHNRFEITKKFLKANVYTMELANEGTFETYATGNFTLQQ